MSETTYRLIDSGSFMKLEQIGPYRLVRPSPGAVWNPLAPSEWTSYDAKYTRHSNGKGDWEIRNKAINDPWVISYGGMTLELSLTSFGHIGLFGEQEDNWNRLREICFPLKEARVLNLFAYTGGSTIACAQAGAQLVHLDASKTSVSWARRNAELNNVHESGIRFIVDDALAFAKREIRRGSKYEGLILDPPSFGRGAKNQVWKIEDHMHELMGALADLMSEDFRFLLLSSHSEGYTPEALKNISKQYLPSDQFQIKPSEMLIKHPKNNLPSGATCFSYKE